MFPKKPHCAIICGATECGKTKYILDLLETEYFNYFDYIVIFCPTFKYNKLITNEILFLKTIKYLLLIRKINLMNV